MGQQRRCVFAEYPWREQLYVEYEAQCRAPFLYECRGGGRRYRYPAVDADERGAKALSHAPVPAPVFLGAVFGPLYLLDLCPRLPKIFQQQGRRRAPEEDEPLGSPGILGIQALSCLPLHFPSDLSAGLV